MVFDLLRERIGQPSEAAHRHPHSEVLAFDVAGADVFRVGSAANSLAFAADALSWAVALRNAPSMRSTVREDKRSVPHAASLDTRSRVSHRSYYSACTTQRSALPGPVVDLLWR
jgi:hypothetical protein